MGMSNMFGSLDFGPVEGYKLSHLGIALTNEAGDTVSYDRQKDEIVNVDLIDFDADGMIYAMPCAIRDIRVGDVIKHVNGHAVFVSSLENGIHVIDVAAGEKKEILPTKSVFGFDFVTKIVSFIDFSSMSASADQPFGNLLPLMLLGKGDGSKDMKSLLPLFMCMGGMNFNAPNVNAENGEEGEENKAVSNMMGFDMNNPMMLLALLALGGGSEGKDFFPLIAATSMMKK